MLLIISVIYPDASEDPESVSPSPGPVTCQRPAAISETMRKGCQDLSSEDEPGIDAKLRGETIKSWNPGDVLRGPWIILNGQLSN